MIAGRLSQKDKMRFFFECNKNVPIPVYKIAAFGLQYGRIKGELIAEGMNIIMCKDVTVDGSRHTEYMYCPDGQGRIC